ncbi:hypothetical protein ABOM_000292 [Aspergillus bombycis]|uniref:Major facilitator superfamily (MFS) profile domain-containing protein n=1 Tax=Aspergillus bombycis TaxID=109264 RepID=A0A1F8AH70_9EURO|nr:hypothetical protein ABOM_000292 [Aspergillus bombycis]OGM51061.1 hypothetical protein ABOM_000292 [Aspergillus bombycis]
MGQPNDKKAPEVANVMISPTHSIGKHLSPSAGSLEVQQLSPPVYHIFSRSRKLEMVVIVSLAAIFSPLSSNIYFPALGDISRDLHTSMTLTTLTITIYMIVQGIAPTFWGSISDTSGRRPVLIGTMVVYIISNIALGASTNYGELMAFRALQAAGSAATISIGAGVIGDITTSAQRGSLVRIFGGVRMLGQGVGPVFGGVLAQYLGFRSIFWFLTICATVSLLTILVLLPETLRSIAGNGTVPLHGLQKPWLYYIIGQPGVEEGAEPRLKKSRVTLRTGFAPLNFLAEIDVFITLFFGSMVTSSTSDLFEQTYNLSTLQVGLTFLGNGLGCMSGSYTIGYLMDYNHHLTEREYCARQNYPLDMRVNLKTHPDFPIETARMRNTWWITILFIVCVAVYGVSLHTHLAVPIILQYIIAYCSTGILTINSALVIDLYPGVAAVQPMVDALGPVYTFVLVAGITLTPFPLLWAEMKSWEPELVHRKDKLEQEFAERTQPWAQTFVALKAALPERSKSVQAVTLGKPTDGKFTYPIEKRRAKENVIALRRAERSLDAFWEAIDQQMVTKADGLYGTAARNLLSQPRILQRTREWIEPEKAQPAAQNKAGHVDPYVLYQPASSVYSGLSARALDVSQPKTKVKTRGPPRPAPAPVREAAALVQPDSIDRQPTFPVDARALKVFRALFFNPTMTSTAGEVAWNDFLHAMTSVGFKAMKLYGSVWQFQPTRLDVERNILFHEPHPQGKLPFRTARRYGRRLSKTYGWFGGMFVSKQVK